MHLRSYPVGLWRVSREWLRNSCQWYCHCHWRWWWDRLFRRCFSIFSTINLVQRTVTVSLPTVVANSVSLNFLATAVPVETLLLPTRDQWWRHSHRWCCMPELENGSLLVDGSADETPESEYTSSALNISRMYWVDNPVELDTSENRWQILTWLMSRRFDKFFPFCDRISSTA